MTPDSNQDVMEMVEETLREDPTVSNDVLQERAAEIDPDVGDLSARSFNARYPLQVKRKLAAEQDGNSEKSVPSPKAGNSSSRRARVRSTLLDFARDVAGAEGRGEVIDVLRNVDKYVDRAVEGN